MGGAIISSTLSTDAINDKGEVDHLLEELKKASSSPSFPGGVSDIFSLKYRALMIKNASNMGEIRDIVSLASKNNAAKKIGGRLILLDPLNPTFLVEQELEGKLLEVVSLFLRIKADLRIKEIIEVKYGFSKDRKFSDWQMHFEDSKRNLRNDLIKHRVLHHNDVKTIFMVEDISIEKHYALKEILIQGESAHGLSITNEYDILKTLHSRCSESEETSGHVMGICDVPDIIHELVRLNLISPLCQMDLFSCIQHHYDLTRVDSFSTKVVISLFYQMLLILRNLNKSDIVHRDIKPENICIDSQGNLLLMDFELAVDVRTSPGGIIRTGNTLVGTSLYIAPESFLSVEYSNASDLWAIGIIVCDLHSHVLPWKVSEDMSPEEVCQIITSQKPEKPPGMADEVWNLLERIFCNCDERISCDDALGDPLFQGLDEVTAFDSHPELQVIRDICNKRGLLSAYEGMSIRKRAHRLDEISKSPKIEMARRAFLHDGFE